MLADNLLDPRECGRLRSAPVTIGGTSYHPLEIPQLIEECFGRILDTAAAIEDPFEQAMSLHDGNIARFRLSPPEYEAWTKIWRQGPRHSNFETG